jgi:hypothetical protein
LDKYCLSHDLNLTFRPEISILDTFTLHGLIFEFVIQNYIILNGPIYGELARFNIWTEGSSLRDKKNVFVKLNININSCVGACRSMS